jgi:hypothetical protein
MAELMSIQPLQIAANNIKLQTAAGTMQKHIQQNLKSESLDPSTRGRFRKLFSSLSIFSHCFTVAPARSRTCKM